MFERISCLFQHHSCHHASYSSYLNQNFELDKLL
jgi:hypothetical protein